MESGNEEFVSIAGISGAKAGINSIGILDIFGFENFKVNSFEQLCINYTNERLQQLYIFYIFKNEEREFIADGLKDFLANLTFEDNQPVLDLLDAKMGIFDLLDESCMITSTDTNLLQNIAKNHKDKPKL